MQHGQDLDRGFDNAASNDVGRARNDEFPGTGYPPWTTRLRMQREAFDRFGNSGNDAVSGMRVMLPI